MATFSTWAALLAQVRNDLASRDATVGSYRAPDGRNFEYRSLEELMAWEGYVAARASAESATTGTPTRRVYARPTSDEW